MWNGRPGVWSHTSGARSTYSPRGSWVDIGRFGKRWQRLRRRAAMLNPTQNHRNSYGR